MSSDPQIPFSASGCVLCVSELRASTLSLLKSEHMACHHGSAGPVLFAVGDNVFMGGRRQNSGNKQRQAMGRCWESGAQGGHPGGGGA